MVAAMMAAYGFEPYATGGNLTAYRKAIGKDGEILITDEEGGGMPTSFFETVLVVRYWFEPDGDRAHRLQPTNLASALVALAELEAMP